MILVMISPPPFRSPRRIALTVLLLGSFFPFAGAAAPVSGGTSPRSLLSLDHWSKDDGWAIAGKVAGDPQKKRWKSVEKGSSILYNGKEGKAGNLTSVDEFGDVELSAVFMIPKSSNSGIYFQGRYEIQILDSYGKPDADLRHRDCGGIYERWNEEAPGKDKGFGGTPPATNASKAPGSWQSFQIVFRAPRFDESGRKTENARFVRVVHNGVTIHEDVEVTGPTRGGGETETAEAPFILQGDHGPIAFRKFEVRRLTLD